VADRVVEALLPSTAHFADDVRAIVSSTPYGVGNLFAELEDAVASPPNAPLSPDRPLAPHNPTVPVRIQAGPPGKPPHMGGFLQQRKFGRAPM